MGVSDARLAAHQRPCRATCPYLLHAVQSSRWIATPAPAFPHALRAASGAPLASLPTPQRPPRARCTDMKLFVRLVPFALIGVVSAFATGMECIDTPPATVKGAASLLELGGVESCEGLANIGYCSHAEAKEYCCETCKDAEPVRGVRGAGTLSAIWGWAHAFIGMAIACFGGHSGACSVFLG